MLYAIPRPRPPNLAAIFLTLLIPALAQAQVIPIKTVPLAAGDQFRIFPSQNLGMGRVSIAVDDPLLDPFVNPAKGSRLSGGQFFVAPGYFSVADENGSGRTLPIGALYSAGRWFGGLSLSIQQLEAAESPPLFLPQGEFGGTVLSDKSANNLYAFGMLGTRIPDSGVSVGASLFWAGLEAVDGVDLLYPGSLGIEQSGHSLDVRIGMVAELEGERTVEAMLLHSRIDMTHDVRQPDFIIDNNGQSIPVVRREINLDQTNTWGWHFGYVQPLNENGWRVGGIFTLNVKDHPKIPNYELMNIPRDPGNTTAFDIGIGVSRTIGPTTYGLDVVYEPIWSNTWAEAESFFLSPDGKTIEPGDKTVENDFRFSNALLRMGVGHEEERAGFQLGLQVRSIDYRLEQVDNVAGTERRQEESWMEWTPSWGGILKFPGLEVRYAGYLTTGTGRPGAVPLLRETDAFTAEADVLIAPTGPLTLQEASVITHQLTISLPLR